MDKRTKTAVGAVAILVVLALVVWYAASPSSTPLDLLSEGVKTVTNSSPVKTGGSATVSHVSNMTVAQIIANLPNVSSFRSYYNSTGVASMVTGKGPYTVFVPVNNAFVNLQKGTISDLSAAEKKRLVEYHVVAGRELDITSLANGYIQTLSKDQLNFTVDLQKNKVSIQSASVVDEYKGSNGTVYLISSVLLPPYTPHP